jgi:hypothetical protein
VYLTSSFLSFGLLSIFFLQGCVATRPSIPQDRGASDLGQRRFGEEQGTGHRGGILQRHANDLGGIDDPCLDEVDVDAAGRVEAGVAGALAQALGHHAVSFSTAARVRNKARPPPGTMPSATAARVAETASSNASLRFFISASDGAPTRITATPAESLARRSWSFSRS